MGTITNIDGEYSLEARRNGGHLYFLQWAISVRQ